MKYESTFIVIIFSGLLAFGQGSNQVIVHTENCNKVVAGIDNYISIVALKGYPISEEQVEAFLYTSVEYENNLAPIQLEIKKENDKFKIHPDSTGLVELRINLNGKLEITTIGVKPLEAVCRLGNYIAYSDGELTVDEIKTQEGLIAIIECCGFDGRCGIIEFEIIRIGMDHSVARVKNKGGKFEETSLMLINEASSGDIYIFRNIYYICKEKLRSGDMIFEIK